MNKLRFVLGIKIKVVCTTFRQFCDILVFGHLYRSFCLVLLLVNNGGVDG